MQALPILEEYLSCAVVWSEFAARNLGPKEVGALFGDIVKHVEGADPVRSETISKVGNKQGTLNYTGRPDRGSKPSPDNCSKWPVCCNFQWTGSHHNSNFQAGI